MVCFVEYKKLSTTHFNFNLTVYKTTFSVLRSVNTFRALISKSTRRLNTGHVAQMHISQFESHVNCDLLTEKTSWSVNEAVFTRPNAVTGPTVKFCFPNLILTSPLNGNCLIFSNFDLQTFGNIVCVERSACNL